MFDSKSLVGKRARHRRGRHRRTFQTIRLFPTLTVMENVMSGRDRRSRAGVVGAIFSPAVTAGLERDIRVQAERHMRLMTSGSNATSSPGTCRTVTSGALEIARALAIDPELLILDEPAAGLNEQESADLMALEAGFRDTGVTIFLIEHDMKVVMGVSDRVMVLATGKRSPRARRSRCRPNPRVIEAYLGRDDEEEDLDE